MPSARFGTCPTRCAGPDPPASTRSRRRRPRTSAFASAISAASAAPRTSRGPWRRFHERAASLSEDGLFVHQYGGSDLDVTDDDGRRLAVSETGDYPWARDGHLHGDRGRAGRDPPAAAHPRLGLGCHAHRQRRARRDSRAGLIRAHRARVERRRRRRAHAADAGPRAAWSPARRRDHQPGRRSAGTRRLLPRERRSAGRHRTRAGRAAARESC